jgi:dTDP-4-dehydrorhamnose 3,5-epimerase
MRITPTRVAGVFLLDVEPHVDERGSFSRIWCRREFTGAGLDTEVAQASLSFNVRKGTLRGLHFQAPPHEEVKIVRCTRGAIFDVAVDLRAGSPTFKQWVSVELTADNRRALYIPVGCAHGFQTLLPDTEVLYQMSTFHVPSAARGVRWNDPAFGIHWPDDNRVISERDRSYPDFDS